jgi:hypothetical protein
VDARKASGREHSGEALFRCRRFQRRAVEEELIPGNGQKQSSIAIGAKRSFQFTPSGPVLLCCSWVAKIIHPRELEQDIEAAHKCASRQEFCVWIVAHIYSGENSTF